MSVQLEGAIRTCKVDTAWANRLESDRFLNPELMVCPVWNGRDLTGRQVCADSFYTKRAGCNSAEDRVVVENAQRPQYMEYVNLDASGIRLGYGNVQPDAKLRSKALNELHNITGNFNLQPSGADIYPRCPNYPYHDSQSQHAHQQRMNAALNQGYMENYYKRQSGFGGQY